MREIFKLHINKQNEKHPYTFQTLYYRMNSNTALNTTYEFDGYLVCRMPADMIEMELKIKTRRGKYTFHEDTNTRTERYCLWERVEKRSKIHTRRSKRGVDSEVSTSSETDIQMGKGFAYPQKFPQIPSC